MPELRVMSWNVLHRIHAVNWNELPVAQFPDEHERIDRITAFLARQLDAGTDVMCLQEVSGDQYARLTEVLGRRAVFFTHRYPRIPQLRDPAAAMKSPLADSSEYLVMIVAEKLGRSARRHAAETFANDFGKGYLAVALENDILVIDTHITWGERGHAQLASVASFAVGPSIIAGDFNAEAATVSSLLARSTASPPLVLSSLAGQRHTRIATLDKASHTIDHILVRWGDLAAATVLDGEGLSDHNPVTATASFP
jgi:endonuclease/exonuclease/phosphatase family metal-dependent hydrolase